MKQRSFIVAAVAMMPFVVAVAQQSPPLPRTPSGPGVFTRHDGANEPEVAPGICRALHEAPTRALPL